MNKILGLISAWGAAEFVELSIKQAMQFCDEVIINTGPYVKNMAKFDDGTRDICNKYKNDITVLDSIMSDSHANAKAATLNHALKISKLHEAGNWFWLFDVDEYYLETQVQAMKEKLFSGDYDHLVMDELYFFINTQKYLTNTRIRLTKITDATNHFIPTNKWSGPRKKPLYDPDFKYFHYSTLMDQSMKKELFKTENTTLNKDQREKIEWVDKIYFKYDLNDEEPWIKLNQKLYGKLQPYWKSDFAPNKEGKLFTYTGQHPKLIEEAGLTSIPDFRKKH
jgi:hypothetical protein